MVGTNGGFTRGGICVGVWVCPGAMGPLVGDVVGTLVRMAVDADVGAWVCAGKRGMRVGMLVGLTVCS